MCASRPFRAPDRRCSCRARHRPSRPRPTTGRMTAPFQEDLTVNLHAAIGTSPHRSPACRFRARLRVRRPSAAARRGVRGAPAPHPPRGCGRRARCADRSHRHGRLVPHLERLSALRLRLDARGRADHPDRQRQADGPAVLLHPVGHPAAGRRAGSGRGHLADRRDRPRICRPPGLLDRARRPRPAPNLLAGHRVWPAGQIGCLGDRTSGEFWAATSEPAARRPSSSTTTPSSTGCRRFARRARSRCSARPRS